MKAAIRSKYGSQKVLSVQEIAKPIPKDHEVLVKVYATTVNRTDCGILWGSPYIIRLFIGFFKPHLAGTGCDFAGQVEAVGKEVKSFRIGDKVMGFSGVLGCQSHAQYLVFPEHKAILAIPENFSYEQAVTCLEGTYYAAFVINSLEPKGGQKMLVYGATGAIGSAMVQILKYYGVYVTAVCKKENMDLVRSLGADKVIDYTTEDFTKDTEKYDIVFDAVGKSSFSKCKPLLKKKGVYNPSDGFLNFLLAPVTRLLGGKRVVMGVPKKIPETLHFIKGLVEKGHFKPVIDRKYPLDKIAEAFAYVKTGQKTGNVILLPNE